MSLLREITDVIVDRSEPYTNLKIKGFRTDTGEEFFIQLVKEKTGWKTQHAFYPAVPESLTTQFLDDVAKWLTLASEILEHPKVRLYTLF